LCIHTKWVRSNKQYQYPSYSLQGQYQYLLTVYSHMHTKRVRPNKQHQHPSYPLQGWYQYLLTFYFVHAHKVNWVKQATSASITFIARTISISTYRLFCAFTQSKLGQTSNINIHHIHCKGNINIYLLSILCIHTKWVGQTSNIRNHHINYKGNINIYLQAILCMYTKQIKSNKQHQHPSYSLQA